ncbi:M24 family metallopeptidase [Candidatus Zixiibacteriota bacterium]
MSHDPPVIPPPDGEVYLKRRADLWSSPELADLDAFLVTTPIHHRYLCGFSGSSASLVLTGKRAHFLTDGRYCEQSTHEVKEADIMIVDGPLRYSLGEHLSSWWRVGFEAGQLTVTELRLLEESYPEITWVPVTDCMERLRAVKDEYEIASLCGAAEIACQVLSRVASRIGPGQSEREIAGELEGNLRKTGSEGSAFEPIVVSGTGSSRPHGKASDRVIGEGECLTIDFGAILNGYHSDLTRTFVLGAPVDEFLEWQGVLDQAIEAALDSMEPGMPCQELDRVARAVIDSAGFGEYFVHNLGHGIGLEVHEAPHISRTSAGTLAVGMAYTIEPGIYVPGLGGMRIEEDVLMTDNGPELLTRFPRSLALPEPDSFSDRLPGAE